MSQRHLNDTNLKTGRSLIPNIVTMLELMGRCASIWLFYSLFILTVVHGFVFWNPRNVLPALSVSLLSSTDTLNLRHSAVELIEPQTNATVVLLGCFHGSQSSAVDVQKCITEDTDIVVLELCASRFDDLRRKQGSKQRRRTPFWETIRKVSAARGFSTGAAAALLGSVSGFQTAMSGLKPGLEFQTALDRVVNASSSTTAIDIVLADQNVDETLQRIGQLPLVSLEMWRSFFKAGWDESFGQEAQALSVAVLGDTASYPHQQLNLVSFLTRHQASFQDLIRLMLPPLGLLAVANSMAGPSDPWTDPFAYWDVLSPIERGVVCSVNGIMIGLGYLCLALPAARVILRERDDVLARGIRTACRVASSSRTKNNKNARIVAVLGLLHVNGVAQRLLNDPNVVDDDQMSEL